MPLTAAQKRAIGVSSWARSRWQVPFVGAFHEFLARTIFNAEKYADGELADIGLLEVRYNTVRLVEVKSMGDSHGGARIHLDQFERMVDAIGFEIGGGAHAIFSWQSRFWDKVEHASISRLTRARDREEAINVLIRNTTRLHILDSKVMEFIRRANGISEGHLVDKKEKCIIVQRSFLADLDKKPAKALQSIGAATKSWSISRTRVAVPFRTDPLNLGLEETADISVTEVHANKEDPLIGLIPTSFPMADLSNGFHLN